MFMGPSDQESPSREQSQANQAPWRPIMMEGSLIFAQSPNEYAVYDDKRVFGRWPLNPASYARALNMFQAYRHSYMTGVAYAATGRMDPQAAGLPSKPMLESRTYASPLSFVGSTRRVISWTKGVTERNPAMGTVAWIAGGIFLIFAWFFIAWWYFFVYFLFGIFVIPYRLVRRSQRKALHVQETTLATQQAMLQQMAYMQRGPAYGQGPNPGAWGPMPSGAPWGPGPAPGMMPPGTGPAPGSVPPGSGPGWPGGPPAQTS